MHIIAEANWLPLHRLECTQLIYNMAETDLYYSILEIRYQPHLKETFCRTDFIVFRRYAID